MLRLRQGYITYTLLALVICQHQFNPFIFKFNFYGDTKKIILFKNFKDTKNQKKEKVIDNTFNIIVQSKRKGRYSVIRDNIKDKK